MTPTHALFAAILLALPLGAKAQSTQDQAAAHIAELASSPPIQLSNDIGILGAPVVVAHGHRDIRLTIHGCLLRISFHTTAQETVTPFVRRRDVLNLRDLRLPADHSLLFTLYPDEALPRAKFVFQTMPTGGAQRHYSAPGSNLFLRTFWLIFGLRTDDPIIEAYLILAGPDLDDRAMALAEAIVTYKSTYCPSAN